MSNGQNEFEGIKKTEAKLFPQDFLIFTNDQCYKKIYVRNLQIFVVSWSVYPWQAFPT
jgi:hypothetical protein